MKRRTILISAAAVAAAVVDSLDYAAYSKAIYRNTHIHTNVVLDDIVQYKVMHTHRQPYSTRHEWHEKFIGLIRRRREKKVVIRIR